MGNKLSHPPGTFCWSELSTTDSAGAKKFYADLMGLKTHDDPIPGGGVYTMLLKEEEHVGALYQQPKEMQAQGIPPHWTGYITVEDAAATARKAKEVGGTVIKDAFDVMDVGSMAVIQDPTGATFAVWQPKKHTGADFDAGEPGTVCWNELATRNADVAGKFYTDLFGWNVTLKEFGDHKYTVFMQGEKQAGGMLQMTAEWGDLPSHWMTYFSVSDCDASAEKAKGLGGQVKVPPTDIPTVGRFSVIQDPQGVVFSVIKLENPSMH